MKHLIRGNKSNSE